MKEQDDIYSRVDYRRVVAWPERIKREGPFLIQLLESAPERSALDLGCGTGEHCRFLAELGFRVVGIDRSPSMLAQAAKSPAPPNLRFIEADLRQLETAVDGRFGAAMSLGNTLVHLTNAQDLQRVLKAVHAKLHEGGSFLFQILNYERIFTRQIRHLPLNFRSENGAEIVFLRLMELLPDGMVRFCPTTLKYEPNLDPPLQLMRSRLVELRGWRRAQVIPMLESAGFRVRSLHGDMQQGDFDPDQSQDLVVVAVKST